MVKINSEWGAAYYPYILDDSVIKMNSEGAAYYPYILDDSVVKMNSEWGQRVIPI